MANEQVDTDHAAQETTRVIIVKKGKHHVSSHGGAWKVAYADFVTAMMAFFIVMWLTTQNSNVKQAVQEYFKDPLGFMEKVQSGMLIGSGPSVIQGSGVGVNQETFEKVQRQKMEEAAEHLKKEFESSVDIQSIKDAIAISITKEGLLVELVESDKTNFFDVGSANLKRETALILVKIAQEFGNYTNRVIIDGHTDARPYVSNSGYSNWELSADRANSARRVMEAAGLWESQVQMVRGNSDQKLKNIKDPFDVTNRRISILLVNRTLDEAKDTLFVRQK